MANTLTIDASAMNGVNLTTWINEYFAQFTTASTAFYGGTPDSAYGGTYYMNGSQVLATLNELVDFDRVNGGDTRLSLGAVNARSGESVYFDTANQVITAIVNT